jgi:hypothetical protein
LRGLPPDCLFAIAFPLHRRNVKFLSALEKAARVLDRRDRLIELYEEHVQEEKSLYGRLRSLREQV